MQKLLQGILNFRRNVAPGYAETFAKLALGQSPDTLLIACSDSRVVPNLFASTEPGDMFVLRNVANLVPPYDDSRPDTGTESEGAAIEFSVRTLGISDIIVCGHSECGGMQALMRGREQIPARSLRAWLANGDRSLFRYRAGERASPEPNAVNQLSQLNVLQQMDHLATYPVIREKMDAGKLRLHGWWFEISTTIVHAWDPLENRFVPIDEMEAERIMQRLHAESSGGPQGSGSR